MRIVYGLYFFYQKLIIPSITLSLVLSYFSMERSNFYAGAGISFIFLTPTFHYFTYEIKNPNEYYFYYNLGLSKLILWTSTMILSTIIGLILIIL